MACLGCHDYFFSRLKLTSFRVCQVYNQTMSTIIVYADLVFAANLVMDWLVLWIAGRLTGRPGKKLWLGAAAVLGAFYALGAALWPYSILAAGWLKLFSGCLLVALAYRPESWLWFWRYCGAFYLVSFSLGGAAFGLWYLLVSTAGLPDSLGRFAAPSAFALPLGVLVMAVLLLADRRQKRRLAMGSFLMELELWLPALLQDQEKVLSQEAGQKADSSQEADSGQEAAIQSQGNGRPQRWKFTAFLDTGHHLTDPASGLPVLVMSLAGLPGPWAQAISSIGWEKLERLSLRTVAGGVKSLPIWGPLVLQAEGKEKRKCMVALTPELLDREGKYQLLAPFELAEHFSLPHKKEETDQHEIHADHY